MSEAKHTPGPWMVIDGTAIWSETFQTNTPIARANRRLDDTTHANARLIAAAPELLEAGKALVNALDRDYLVNDDQRQGFDLLLAAIAKATGGAK